MKYTDTQIGFQEFPDEISLLINISNCPFHCPGCHSPELWEDVGTELTYGELNRLIEINKGITLVGFMGHSDISGIKIISNLSEYIKKEFNLKIGIYSGINNLNYFDINIFDYVKIGRFDNKFGPLNKFTTNQSMFKKINNKYIDITDKFWIGWKKINSHYCISDKGEVYSKYINKCLSPGKNQKGYLKVTIKNDDGTKSCKFVHRLVAEYFLDNYSDKLQVNHKDENKENNHVSNLEMCDSNYNNNYGNRNIKSANTHKLGLIKENLEENLLELVVKENEKLEEKCVK